MREDNQSLSHTTWNCKYHIVFAPRRTHENFLFILLCPDINFEKIPF